MDDAPHGRARCCWQWKRDTSSDEVAGHVFTLLVVHELLARSDAERARAARLLCASVAYIQDGGYKFIDPVSKKGTSWGYWDPAQLNGVPGKPNERGENSLELLAFLAAAAKVCDASATPKGRFGDAFATMVSVHGYDRNVLNALATSPLSLATFDTRLAFMSYFTLALSVPHLVRRSLKQPTSPHIPLSAAASAAFKGRLLTSIDRYWNESGATITPQSCRVAFAASVHAYLSSADGAPPRGGTDASEYQLRRYPLPPLVDWPSTNSHRHDVKLSRDWAACPSADCGNGQAIEGGSLPADEALAIGSADFVTEPGARSVDGGGGKSENAPNSWLLAFWASRYVARDAA